MILPPYLAQLGYETSPVIKELQAIAFVEKGNHIAPVQPWWDFKDILEYLTCVEFARHQLLQLPVGRGLGTVHVVPARFNSASLVFFAQATLDNLAVWLNRIHRLGLKGNSISFYKSQIGPLLLVQSTRYDQVLSRYKDFVLRLNSYRMEWLHRLAGGAEIYSNKSPSDSNADISIQIPLDPKIPSLRGDPKKYLALVQEVQKQNGGKWLIPVTDFANEIGENTVGLTLAMAEVALTFKGKV